MVRRRFGALFLALALVFPVYTAASQAHAKRQVKITLMAYGGADGFDKKYINTVIKPFEALHPDIQVAYYPVRGSRNALSVLRAQKLAPKVDVVMLDLSFARVARQENLLAPIDRAQVPNAANLAPIGQELGDWALPVTYDTMALVYARSAFPRPPTSWRTLWDPQYIGKIALPINPKGSVTTLAMTIIASHLAGALYYPRDIEAGISYLAKLGPQVASWRPRPDQYWAVAHNQALLTIGWNARGQSHIDALGPRLGTAVPAEGTVMQVSTLSRVAERPNAAQTQAFINYALSPEAQKAFSEAMFFAPTNQKTIISEAARKRIPLMSRDNALRLISVDSADFTDAQLSRIFSAWRTRIMITAP